MTDSEKWAWWTLGVVALTIAPYFAFVTGFGSQKAATAVFALLPAGLRALWVVFIGLALAVGLAKGWEDSVTLPLYRRGAHA